MKNIGIWLDKDKAHLVTIENSVETFSTIPSKIEHYNILGGSGTAQKGGPQDVVQDRKYLEREKHQLKRYFKAIATEIEASDALVIYGPADTNEKFGKELHENYNSLSKKIKGIKKADSMSDNQFIALVRDFFAQNN
jgi:stalled ribosome rescue protein Dom34